MIDVNKVARALTELVDNAGPALTFSVLVDALITFDTAHKKEVDALRRERDAYRNLVDRAQIVAGRDLPPKWHQDVNTLIMGRTQP